jgi:PBP1b-binding outer membrane lipoprotein LpoB
VATGPEKKERIVMKTQKILYAVAAILLILSLSACGSGSSGTEGAAETVDLSKFTYVNDDMGFGIIYPEDFNTLSEDEINTAMADNIESIKAMFGDPEEAEAAIKQSVPVSQTLKYPSDYADGINANINIIVQEVPPIDDIVDVTSQIVQGANSQTSGLMTFEEPTAAQVGGKDAAVTYAIINVPDMELITEQYYVANNGRLAIISLSASDEEELNELEAIIDTIEFFK